jgi:hypothetical protein
LQLLPRDHRRPPYYAGRATAHLPLVKLAVYRIGGFEAGEEPLVPEPITLRRQTGRDTYLCQFVNDENRAFRDLITTVNPTAGFPAAGFGASQDASNKWVHNARGEARRLTDFYDFVLVDQQEE